MHRPVLQNVSHSRIGVATVAAVALNAKGQVVDVASQLWCLDSLDPGAIGTFTVNFCHAQGATHYEVYVQTSLYS